MRESVISDRAPRRIRIADKSSRLRMDPVTDVDFWKSAAVVHWNGIDSTPLLADDASRVGLPVPLRVAVNRRVPQGSISPATAGSWTALPDGGSLWTIRLEADGAKALRIHFSKFDVPIGATLRVRGVEGDVDIYSGSGPNSDRSFWTAPTPGESAYVEFFDSEGSLDPRIEIDEISHFYRDPGFDPPAAMPDTSDGDGGVAGLLPCQEDVMCHEVDENARDSVGRMLFTVPGQGSFVCSGALLSDADPNTYAGYFLTANHCISDQATANSLTVYWFYQATECQGRVPSTITLPRSIGAKLLAHSSQSDFSFLRFNNDPEDGQGFAAWTTIAPSGVVRGIHHPGGSFKRFSEGATTLQQPICGGLPTARFVYNDWSVGITEGGSSGSPLFNTNWEVVGQLYGVCYFEGTSPGCNNPDDYNNVYGRFSSSYTSFSTYLDTIIPDDEYEDNDSTAEARELVAGEYALRLVDLDDYFQFSVAADSDVTVSAAFNPADMNLDLFLLDSGGTVVDSSAGATGVETLNTSVVAGSYYIRAVKETGWGGDYTLSLGTFLSGCTPPPAALAETNGFIKNRFISVELPATSQSAAIRVSLVSLQHPDPPNAPGFPPQDFSAFEGQVRWVGPSTEYVESVNPPATFLAAALQCEPYFTDWSTVGLIHLFGPEIVPSSRYEVALIGEGCDPSSVVNYSVPLTVETGMWGDVAAPFQSPSPASRTQPDISDVAAIVDKFKSAPGAAIVARAMLQPNTPNPMLEINFADVSAAVDAFKGFAYPYPGPTDCP